MTDKEIKKTLESMQRVAKEVGKTPETAHAFLVKVGIVTKSGRLAKPYR